MRCINNSYFFIFYIFFINIAIFPMIHTHFFKSKKIDVNIKELLQEQLKEEELLETDDCLVSISEARTILKEKYNLNPDYINIDNNIRFILGKCNPIIYVPGLYASRLVASINCPVLKKDFMNFVKMRLFCGTTICSNESNTYEEYVLFPAIFDSPFELKVSNTTNRFTGCLGYFNTFFNKKTECPEDNCEYSDGIRINFYGSTKKTIKESKCGIKALEDILYAGDLFPPYVTNRLINGNLYVLIDNYRKMGITDGFSSGGVSYDYRRYLHSLKSVQDSLEYQINRLYRNTGKPVIIITQSLGGVVTYNALLQLSPELKKKIKSFVPMVPPFAGSSIAIQAYLYGISQFDTDINILDIIKMRIELSTFSESMYFSSIPITCELRPTYGVLKALEKPEFAKLKLAIEEIINVEKECWDKNCPKEKIEKMTKNYYEIFGDDFPSLAAEDCLLDEQDIKNIKQDNKTKFFTRKCVTNLYNIIDCPLMLYENDFKYNVPAEHLKELCGIFNKSLLYISNGETCEPKKYNEIFGLKKNEEKKSPLDNIFDGNSKYPYNTKKFQILLDDYNKNFAKQYNKTLSKEDFVSEEEFQKRSKRNVEYADKKSLIKDLPVPPVNTYIIYGNFIRTNTGFIYNKSQKDKSMFDEDEFLKGGGDETVPNYSTFLTGLKWLYEKKKNNLEQEIKLIEYCSLVGKNGTKYAYNKETFKNKTYVALKCQCMNEDYKSFNEKDCTHSASPQDPDMIGLIKNEIIFDENNLNDFNENKRNAIKIYNKSINYEQVCNDALYYLNREDAEQVDWF